MGLPTALMASAIIVSSATISGCTPGFSRPPTPTPIAIALPETGSSQNAPLYTVERGSISNSVEYSGRVALSVEEDIFFRRSGQVTNVFVHDGEAVKKDALIAELDTSELKIALELAEISLEITELRLLEAEENLNLIQQNVLIDLEIAQLRLDAAKANNDDEDRSSTSSAAILEKSLEKSEIALAQTRTEVDPVLQLNVDRAKLNLQQARKNLLDARISAPFDGEIRFINLPDEEGRQTAARSYESVARLIDPNSLTIEMNLTKEQLSTLTEGMPVSAVALTRSGEVTLPGTISALPIPFGTGNGTLTEVALSEDGATLGLIEGSTVDVQINLADKDNALVVPVAALRGFSGQYFVRVQDGTQQKTIDVEVGIQNSTHAEILSGLTEGQSVIGNE